MITYLRECRLLGLVNGLWMSVAIWVLIIWLTSCGGSPQASLQQPATPPPTVIPPSVPPPPTIPHSWTMTDLTPLPGFNASQANAVNSAGTVVGYSESPDGTTKATEWVNGSAIDLGPGIATAINDSGQVVGYSLNQLSLVITAHIWLNGSDTDLGPWLPNGINSSGTVVGDDGTQALEWTAAGGLVTIPGCTLATAVNNAGQVSGIATNGNATICGSVDYGQPGVATAINASGQTVGYLNPTPGTANAVLFPDTVLAQSGLATGINYLGWVVGETITSGGTNAQSRAMGSQTGEDRTGDGRNPWLRGRFRHGGLFRDAIASLAGQSHPWIWSQQSGLIALPDPLITAEGISGMRVVGAGMATDGTIHGMLLEGK